MTRRTIDPAGYTVSLCGHDIPVYFRFPQRFFVPVAAVAAAIEVDVKVLPPGRQRGYEHLVMATVFHKEALRIECPHQLEFLQWARRIENRQLSAFNYLYNAAFEAVSELSPSLTEAYRMLYSSIQREREIIIGAVNPAYLDILPIATAVREHWEKDPAVQVWFLHTLRDNAPPPPVLQLPAGLIFERTTEETN